MGLFLIEESRLPQKYSHKGRFTGVDMPHDNDIDCSRELGVLLLVDRGVLHIIVVSFVLFDDIGVLSSIYYRFIGRAFPMQVIFGLSFL